MYYSIFSALVRYLYTQVCINFLDLNAENFDFHYTKTTIKTENFQSSTISPKLSEKL